MANQDLLDYIEQAHKAGLDDQKIREELLKAGWKPEQIDQAFLSLINPNNQETNSKQTSNSNIQISNGKPRFIFKPLTWALLIFGAIGSYAGGAYYMTNYQELPLWPFETKIEPLPSFAPISERIDKATALADPTADWQTYRNEEYGFEIKYPGEFNPKILRDQISFSTASGSSIDIYFDLYSNPNNLPLEQWCTEDNILKAVEPCLSWQINPQFETKYLTINGYNIIYIEEKTEAPSEEMRKIRPNFVPKISNYYLTKNNIIYSIRALYENSVIADEMIKTFKFTK